MKPRRHSIFTTDKNERAALDAAAADWLIAYDRGMTAQQQREFDRWLAADPRHAEAWGEAQGAWARLDRLPELAPLATSSRISARRRIWPAVASAAAAALVIGFFMWPRMQPASQRVSPEVVRVAPKQRALSDGTRVELNADSEVAERFTVDERRVRLVRGEAHFTVVKNTARPFVVEAGGVVVRAVGTAFNVRLDSTAVEVLVTEGQVRVDTPARERVAPAERTLDRPTVNDAVSVQPALLAAGQRAIVGLTAEAPPPQIAAVSPVEMARALAWQALRLQFHDMPLKKVAAEFNRHNRTRLVVDASAANVLVAGSFRAENVELFVHFLEEAFNVAAEQRSEDTIMLRKAQ